MPQIRIKKRKKKSILRRIKHRLTKGAGQKHLRFYIFILAAVLLGLLAGFYMLKWLNKVEEQPVESMQHSPAEMTQIANC